MDFERLFRPKTMAVVGVSQTNDRHPANVVYHKNHLRYPVKVFPVNPRGGDLHGERIYPGIREIPEAVDLVLIAVRADVVPGVLSDCIASGAGGAAVISGGFAEVGRTDLQDRIASMAREANFPLIGPNCLGIYSPSRVNTFFIPSERMIQPERGAVAMISQSGGILVDHMIKFAEEGVGMSLAVSIGNKAFVKETDLLLHLVKDPETKVLAFYIEGFGNNEGREFVLSASQCSKPVVVLKSGKTPGGNRAVSSHTASLGGDYKVFSEVLAQYGIIEARNELELVSFCESLSCYSISVEGKIGIITGSGGHGAMAVDLCTAHGLGVPPLSSAFQHDLRARLSESVKSIASLVNPVDLTGSTVDDDFVAATTVLSKQPEIDCILILLLPYIPGVTSDLGARLSQILRREGKPLVAYVPHVEKYRMLIEGFELNQVPVSPSIEGAVSMAEALRRWHRC